MSWQVDPFQRKFIPLGPGRFRQFKKMIAAVNARDFPQAAAQMKASRWYLQVGKRAETLTAMMRKEYDFENMKSRKNPYAGNLKKQVTIRIGVDIIDYFKKQAEETGIPYQNLINLYLRDCVQSNRKLSINWTR